MSAPNIATSAPGPTPADIAKAFCDRAAVVGAFDPWALLAAVAPSLDDIAVEDAVLSLVSPQVEEVMEGTAVLWRLKPEPRREALDRLAARKLLDGVITAARPRPQDLFGAYLQSTLVNGAPTLTVSKRAASDDELRLQALALDFAEPIPALKPKAAKPGVLDPRILIARRAERNRQNHVAPQQLIGRDAEAAALDRYVVDGSVIAPLSRLPKPAGTLLGLRPLLLTGIGGSGKSALVADLMRRTQGSDWSGPIVVCLDFDQRTIALGGEREWLNEVTRQIGFMRPVLDGLLARVRSETRQHIDTVLRDRERIERLSGTEGLAIFAAMRARLAEVLSDGVLADDTLVMILDTFEEILVRSDLEGPDPEQEPFGQVLAFVDSLARLAGPDGRPLIGAVRAVAAGRVAPFPSDDVRLARWFEAHDEVGELDVHSAAELLRTWGSKRVFTAARALRLAKGLPCYPLILKLLVAFAEHRTGRELDSLIEGPQSESLLGTEVATRALYSRFLERLKDHRITDPTTGEERVVHASDLRKLAYPGLALPVVTPRLIREVLAVPTGLGVIGEQRARDLFTALSREVWMVERSSSHGDAVRHVPALRRIMLPMLNGDLTQGANAQGALSERGRDVHRAAAAWYRGAGAGEPDAPAMAGYHEAFLGEVEALRDDVQLVRRVLDVAGDDISAMPVTARALLRREDVSAARLSAVETAALPEPERRSAEAEQQQRRLKAGVRSRPKSAPDALAPPDAAGRYRTQVEEALASPPPQTRRQVNVLADRQIAQIVEAHFAEGDFAGVLEQALPAVVELGAAASNQPPLNLDETGDLITHWVWKWALACLATGTGDERLLRWMIPTLDQRMSRDASPPDGVIAWLVMATVALGRAPSFARDILRQDAPVLAQVLLLPPRSTWDLRRHVLISHLPDAPPPGLPRSPQIALSPLCLAGLWPRIALPQDEMVDGPGALVTLPSGVKDRLVAFARQRPLMSAIVKGLEEWSALGETGRLWSRGDRPPADADLPANLRPATGLLLRGRMPEFSDLVRVALGDVAREQPEALAGAVLELQGLATFWPADLSYDAMQVFRMNWREAEYLLSYLVIFADLAGLTGHLFALLARRTVTGKRFQDVARLVSAYERLLLAPFGAEGALPAPQ
ncbi:hypothetical protein [Xanthobacter versatilis]|uniref:hypothetical protein n=1 Tax=Xanthobacter autotrophicus (strain ATCC BAA-1158 / Py2) TaxID=78245 RepID=UPI003729F797